jgi:hypothetical protein
LGRWSSPSYAVRIPADHSAPYLNWGDRVGGTVTNVEHFLGVNPSGNTLINGLEQYGFGIRTNSNDFAISTNSGNNSQLFLDASSQNVGVKTSNPTSTLDISGNTGYNQLRLRTSYTPTSSSDTNGNVGDMAWDDNYFYWKTSSQWLRVSGQTF